MDPIQTSILSYEITFASINIDYIWLVLGIQFIYQLFYLCSISICIYLLDLYSHLHPRQIIKDCPISLKNISFADLHSASNIANSVCEYFAIFGLIYLGFIDKMLSPHPPNGKRIMRIE